MEDYEKYLEIIDAYLAKFFEQQKDYIFCKEGCSMCCESGTYPLSRLEFSYIMLGFEKLSDELKKQIKTEIKLLKEGKNGLKEEKFLHKCPFLSDEKCSVYKSRPLICRSYGLMNFYIAKNGEKRYNLPCCISEGLNYSNVYDEAIGAIATEKWKQAGIEVEPVSFNTELTFLKDNDLTKHLNLEFGEKKDLLDWL